MRYCVRLPSLLTLSALGLVACGEETTQPNTAVDQPTAPQFAVTSNTWLTRRDMPFELVYQATAVVPNAAGQSILYVFGGAQTGDLSTWHNPAPVGEVRAYNVATNSWAWKRDMPAVRYEMNAEVIKGKIYLPGGFTTGGRPTASLYVYDPASDTWSRKRDMPVPGGAGVTGVIGGKLYVVSFNWLFRDPRLESPVANFFRYDPARDSWTRLPSPTGYNKMDPGGTGPNPGGTGVINNKLYLIGGDRALEYNPATNQWTSKKSYGMGLTGRTVPMLSRLYVFGGAGEWYRGIYIYDPVSDTWTSKPLLTQFWSSTLTGAAAAKVFLNGQPRVEVVGGQRGQQWLSPNLPGSPGNNQQYIP
jgi:N-acetylneuraminic acid mutarotase